MLNTLIFLVNEQEFNLININQPDAAFLESTNLLEENEILFSENNQGGFQIHTPSPSFQNRFIRCVREGMCNFMSITKGPRVPSCNAFTGFLESGISTIPARIKRCYEPIPISKIPKIGDFSVLRLHNNNSLIHETIYIGNGICFSKIGTNDLFFHTLEEIIQFYSKYSMKDISLLKSNYKDDEPPPPSSGTSGSASLVM